jgi:tRNA 5-methylaminomethyl-2-thiouridine biosynthesis bifunctional protein
LLQEGLRLTGPRAEAIHHEVNETLSSWPLQAIKGQLSMGEMKDLSHTPSFKPSFAVNGQSSWMGSLPNGLSRPGPTALEGESTSQDSELFCIGASYERDRQWVENTTESRWSNVHKFKALLPTMQLNSQARLDDWSGVRSTCHDRLPIVGALSPELPGLLVCTALGSRGLSMGAMLSNHLCALITGEPSPLPKRLIQAIGTQRFLKEKDSKSDDGPQTYDFKL